MCIAFAAALVDWQVIFSSLQALCHSIRLLICCVTHSESLRRCISLYSNIILVILIVLVCAYIRSTRTTNVHDPSMLLLLLTHLLLGSAAVAAAPIEFSSSALMFYNGDLQRDPDLGMSPCELFVKRAAAHGGRKIQLVPTHYWWVGCWDSRGGGK